MALEVEPLVVAHAVLIAAILAEADAEENVVTVVVLTSEEVGVVGRDDRKRELLRQREDAAIEIALPFRVVCLNLQIVAVLEDIRVPRGCLDRGVMIIPQKMRRDFPGHACRGHDDPLAVLRQQLSVDTGLGIEAFCIRERGELDEVAATGQVSREQDQMIVWLLSGAISARSCTSVTGGDVRLHSDDRLELFLPRMLLKLPGSVQITVVGNRQGGLLELFSPPDQIVDPVRAVEEGVF